MRKLTFIFGVLLAVIPLHSPYTIVAPPVHEFANGNWFDGQKFVVRKFYTAGGLLTSRKPPHVDRVIDLTGKFVVPPFGEAHNHNLDWTSDEQFARLKRMYIEGGVFYIKNPNSLPRSKKSLAGKINIPSSVDGIFSNGGLTASGGHPIEIVTPQRGFKPNDGEGGFYFVIDTKADLDRKWPAIVEGKPDFIKTYLLYSEEYAKRKSADSFNGWKGLDPAILPDIVRRAHRDGLRVSTHVESAVDFHNALAAGVDEINHTPGFRPEGNNPSNYKDLGRYRISESDARLAARNHVVVVTTVGETLQVVLHGKEDGAARNAVLEMLLYNLHLLHKHGVNIAIGSDSFRQTSVPEALALHEANAFDNVTLLKMWCETTASAIFPKRKIGYLKEGYEASFLVLSGDPLQDFGNVRKIEMRVKQGELLSP